MARLDAIDKALSKGIKMLHAASMTDPLSPSHTPEGAALTSLILAVFRVNGRLLRDGDNMTRDLGLTAARWQVMGALVDRPRTVAQIGRYFELTRQSVLWVVNALLKDGFVELVTNPDHKRAKLVQFTNKGREAYDEVSRRQAAWVNGFGGHFSLGEIEAARAVLERLGEELLPTD